MLSHEEVHRLAAALNSLRPDWPARSIATFIDRELKARTYREAAVALAWVATDPTTETPKRVLEQGPWWLATRAQAATVSVIPTRCGEHPEHRASSCPECTQRSGDAAAGAELARRAIRAGRARFVPEHQRAAMARARAASKEATSE